MAIKLKKLETGTIMLELTLVEQSLSEAYISQRNLVPYLTKKSGVLRKEYNRRLYA